jgi:hypothetical protein
MTDEDNPHPAGAYYLYSDIKAVVGDASGYNWSESSFVIVDDRTNTCHCSWQGLIRLHNEDLLCTFWNGPEGASGDEIRSTSVEFRPAVFADDFGDGSAQGWSPSGNWAIVGGSGGDFNYSCNGAGMSHVGLPKWTDYVMSVDLESFTGEAGIVFHEMNNSCYFLGVNKGAGLVSVWKYVNGTRQQPALATGLTAVAEPIVLRMTRLSDGSFLCYANGAQLRFSDPSFSGGRVGLRVQTGSATFDNVTVHGANAFLDLNTGFEEFLIDDRFHHINISGTPFMWGLRGDWAMVNDANRGIVLRGTASSGDTEAFRGDEGWINKPGETSYMNYLVQADIKLQSATDKAGLCLRVADDEYYPGYGHRFYQLQIDGQNGNLRLWDRYIYPYPVPHWEPEELGSVTLPNPTQWHTIAVEAIGDPVTGNSFKCYLDGDPSPCISATSSRYSDGLVGLWVESGQALFDNVKVLDLR